MGCWGYKLYDNDTALDVKEEFVKFLKQGMDCLSATIQLIKSNAGILLDEEECSIFWFALADTQWKYGILLDEVREFAIQHIESEEDLKRWEDAPKSEYNKRKEVLYKLKEKLLSPQPPQKKIRIPKLYHCEWKVGDVYAYELESEKAKELGLLGRYLLIQKIDETTWYPGHIIPIVYIKLTADHRLPTCVEEYEKTSYIQVYFCRYEFRLNPYSTQEEYEQRLRCNYEMDEFGHLPEFRISLITTSKRMIPKKLIYVNNFGTTTPPEKEYVPHIKINIPCAPWKSGEDTIETNILKRYCLYNLRQCEAYQIQK